MNGTTTNHPTGWSIALGILLILCGLFAIAIPFIAGIAASVVFGWLILFGGVMHLVYAWSERGAGAVIWQILIGLAYLAAAFWLLTRPVAGLAALTVVLAFYIAVEGVLELIVFASVRRFRGSYWFLIDGIISLVVAGLIFWQWPFSSVWAIGTLLGISLLFSGMARLTMPVHRRRLILGGGVLP